MSENGVKNEIGDLEKSCGSMRGSDEEDDKPVPWNTMTENTAKHVWDVREIPTTSQLAIVDEEEGDKPSESVPRLSLLRLCWIFLTFGFRAWGGPSAQTAMIKKQLVTEQNWISPEQFDRVLAIYRTLPGAEPTELCCYFGMLSRGCLGAVVGGLAFTLPGFLLMLLASWIYADYGLDNYFFQASFRGVNAATLSFIFQQVPQIVEQAVKSPSTQGFNLWLFLIFCLSVVQALMRVNFFIILVLSGLLALVIHNKRLRLRYRLALCGTVLAACFVGYVIYVVFRGLPSEDSLGAGPIGTRTLWGLFTLGLLAALLTFGGAYSAIPFVRQNAVAFGGWLTDRNLLDGIAMSSVLPTRDHFHGLLGSNEQVPWNCNPILATLGAAAAGQVFYSS